MQEKVLKTLEYDKIAEMLKAKTVTCAGAELAEGMEPYDTFDKVKSALAFTAEAETVIIRTGRSPIDSFPDMRECLKRIHAALFVSPAELMGISRCLRVSRLAKEAVEREENVPLLSNLAGYISTHRSVEEEKDILKACWSALTSLFNKNTDEVMLTHISFLSSHLSSVISQAKHRSHSSLLLLIS